jgi:indole-3-glycerol phosphate synthase
LAEAPRGFRRALESAPRPRVIAEIKRRSPSRGEIRADFDAAACARAYAGAGAAALSVLTDERYFGGSLAVLAQVREAVSLPLLRKDFIVDAYQVDEARVHGADAVLLIAAALDPGALRGLAAHAEAIGLDALVEVHDERELEAALAAGADLIGINNRDLRTFEVDLGVTERLAGKLPEGCVVVSESGIFTARDWERLEAAGAHAFLVGEALMRESDVGAALRRLRREK